MLHQHCLVCRERTEASDFNAALYEHTQYLRRTKEALEMREAYESTADETGSSPSSSQSGFSLKPGETITLKLAKVLACSTYKTTLEDIPRHCILDAANGKLYVPVVSWSAITTIGQSLWSLSIYVPLLSECHDDSSHPVVQTQLSPPASGSQPLPRLGSANAQLPRFQAATATSGQIPLLAPPPAKSPGPTLARLSGTPGDALIEHVTHVAIQRDWS